MKRYLAAIFMLFSIVAIAETEFSFGGQLVVELDEYKEKDGLDAYSTTGDGNIFGSGDWKGSTNDNYDDTAEQFTATLDLNMEAKINENVTVFANIETLTEEFTGITNGTEETEVQEGSTVRDNESFNLKELRVDVNTEVAEIRVTNDFNYNFNPRVLYMQLEDNSGEPVAYGEGIYAKGKNENFDLQTFMFQSSDEGSDDDTDQEDYEADYMVYGIDINKDFDTAKFEVLAINTHDKSSDVSGDTYGKDMDVQHYALSAEIEPFDFISAKAEYITANYGDDVTEIDNFLSNVLDWYPETYSVETAEEREDNSIYEGSVTIRPMLDLDITLGYKDVGEDYYAVLGNSHQMDYWGGDAELDANEGLGYEKGIYGELAYFLPVAIDIKNTITYENFEATRSAEDDDEDTSEEEIEALFEFGDEDFIAINSSIRRNEQKNSGDGSVDKLHYIFYDYNVNGTYKVQFDNKTNNIFALDLNYYTGDDEDLAQNFSNEKRLKASSVTEHKLNDQMTLKGVYRFGIATEDNDVIQNAKGIQNVVKLGFTYTVSPDCVIDVFYKFDDYELDRDATSDELYDSVYKKESEHQWYDGVESWDHEDDTDDWKKELAAEYGGYTTHELYAKLTVKF